MSGSTDGPRFATVEALMAHAYAIEAEAEERYRDLAAQMEAHNNDEVAALFRRLAEYEGQHAREIESRAEGLALPDLAPWEYQWEAAEAPELVDTLAMHYLMTPRPALVLARAAERRAFAFFDHVARTAEDAPLRDLAAGFAEEEAEHIRMIEDLLERYPETAADAEDDLDSPAPQA